MSETEQDQRTERASPRRLEQARERGQVPRSRELSSAAVYGAALALMFGAGSQIAAGTLNWMTTALRLADPAGLDPVQLPQRLGDLATKGFVIVAPLMLATFAAALLAPLLIGGWNLSTKALMPDFSRISPAKGLGRLWSMNGLGEVGKALLKGGLIFGVAGMLLWGQRDQMIALGQGAIGPAISAGLRMCLLVMAQLGGVLLLIAAIDVGVQLFTYYRQLRMSKQEVRDENKESEGRPEVKAKIRQLQQAISSRRMMEAIPTADVVVTNPTHYAVALQYQEGRMRAPRVVAKGAGEVAARIREIARENRVPLLSAPPLARALFRSSEIGDEIPAALYNAVAQVLTWVYQLKNRSAGPTPTPPKIELPPGLDPATKPMDTE
jgi:flagellar biosynthetic protein FlhB